MLKINRFTYWLIAATAVTIASGPARAAFEFTDIACETTSTAGTGTVSLAGALTGGYLGFLAAGIDSGNTIPYHIKNGVQLETGIGTFTDAAPDTMTRTPFLSTNGSGVALTLSGTSTVCIGPTTQIWTGGASWAMSIGTAGTFTTGTIELGAASDTTLARTAAGEASIEGDRIKHAGRQTIPLVAGAGTLPSGGAIATCTPISVFDSGTNDVFMRQCTFSATTDNAIYFTFFFPKSAAESTNLVAQIDWTSATGTDGTDNVIWTAAAVCFGNDDSINANAFPIVDTVTDTQTAAGDYLVSGEITTIAPAGTPAEGDGCVIRFTRDADAAGDDFNGTADLIQVRLYYVDDASSDD